jgi:hypothetical protein
MTTSPGGELVPVEQRLAEILDRYGPGHLVSRSIQRATPTILGAVKQVHNRAAHIAWLRGPSRTTRGRPMADRCLAWLYVAWTWPPEWPQSLFGTFELFL